MSLNNLALHLEEGVNSPDSIDEVAIENDELLDLLPVVQSSFNLSTEAWTMAWTSGSMDNDSRSAGFPFAAAQAAQLSDPA